MLRHTFHGLPTGPAVVLLHGFSLDARMWDPQVGALRETHRVLTLDLPGFGPPPIVARAGDLTLAGAVAELLDQVATEPSHVVGLSLGGAVAVDLTLAFARHVRSLTLIDALLLGRPSGITQGPVAAALAAAGDLAGAREAWLADPLFAPAAARPAVAAAARAMVADYSGDHWRGRAATRFEVRDPAARLAEIAVPTLVLVGEKETPGFRAMSDAYAAAISRATLRVIPGAGHLASMEEPEAVNAALAGFLGTA